MQSLGLHVPFPFSTTRLGPITTGDGDVNTPAELMALEVAGSVENPVSHDHRQVLEDVLGMAASESVLGFADSCRCNPDGGRAKQAVAAR